MIDVLLLRLDAPLISFGGPQVDNYGVVQPAPARSMLTGLLANALGYEHGDFPRLQRLQARLSFAARRDRPGEPLSDFQTVDLGQPFLTDDNAWTTWGKLDPRKGGPEARTGTHIRYRDYRADSVHTVALTLDPLAEEPDLDLLEQALKEPARPLFIGRKCCLPAAPLLLGRIQADTPARALMDLPRLPQGRTDLPAGGALTAWWDAGQDIVHELTVGCRELPVTDERDWENQVHCGRRVLVQSRITPPEDPHGN